MAREFKGWGEKVAALQAAYWNAKAKAKAADRELKNVEAELEEVAEIPGRVSYGFDNDGTAFYCEALCTRPIVVMGYDSQRIARLRAGQEPCLCDKHGRYAPLVGALREHDRKGYELVQLAIETKSETDRRVAVDYYLEAGGTDPGIDLKGLRAWLIDKLPADQKPVDLRDDEEPESLPF